MPRAVDEVTKRRKSHIPFAFDRLHSATAVYYTPKDHSGLMISTLAPELLASWCWFNTDVMIRRLMNVHGFTADGNVLR